MREGKWLRKGTLRFFGRREGLSNFSSKNRELLLGQIDKHHGEEQKEPFDV